MGGFSCKYPLNIILRTFVLFIFGLKDIRKKLTKFIFLIKLLIKHPWTSIVELRWLLGVFLTNTRLLQILTNILKNNLRLVCHYNIFVMGENTIIWYLFPLFDFFEICD